MRNPILKNLAFSFIVLSLGGCSFFNNIGDHMPVIGERCENWQCFTTSGQEASDARKRMMQQQNAPAHKPVNAPDAGNDSNPLPAPQSVQQPPAQLPPQTSYPTPQNQTGVYSQPDALPTH